MGHKPTKDLGPQGPEGTNNQTARPKPRSARAAARAVREPDRAQAQQTEEAQSARPEVEPGMTWASSGWDTSQRKVGEGPKADTRGRTQDLPGHKAKVITGEGSRPQGR